MNGRVELITQAEYARRRGVAKSAVAKAVKEGRITLLGGKIDPAVADIQWQQNTRARADSGRAGASLPIEQGGGQSAAENAPQAPDSQAAAPGDDYQSLRVRREYLCRGVGYTRGTGPGSLRRPPSPDPAYPFLLPLF